MNVKELFDTFVKDGNAAFELYGGGKIVEIQGYVTYVRPDAYALPSIEISDK
ncbi:hypothetical protein GGR06_003617 [Bacteroides reticulotermitis]|uniref:Uncharacterized protein n=2 Tax=Bacteroides reticulotermitis TaxID=1133319 RepID=W4UUR5_9BACE|nr:hypothetical protein [Bacteroides reticulotermitis]MBB4045795.1 hypothetical protein [Bacteroides reticulotermitis]GAE84940.1 hypothetical protein JCM10512_3322 [Bacteroides reticulotermitis JCM 10512]